MSNQIEEKVLIEKSKTYRDLILQIYNDKEIKDLAKLIEYDEYDLELFLYNQTHLSEELYLKITKFFNKVKSSLELLVQLLTM